MNTSSILFCLVLTSTTLFAAGRHETITVNSSPWYGPVVTTNTLVIGTNQSLTIKTLYGAQMEPYLYPMPPFKLELRKDGNTFWLRDHTTATPVAGPATLVLRLEPSDYKGYVFLTAEIEEAGFSPERCAILAPGSAGAAVAMQCSSNLLDWVEATNGVYQSARIASFFRINISPAAGSTAIFENTAKEIAGQLKTLTVFGNKTSDEITIGPYQTAEIVAVGQHDYLLVEMTSGPLLMVMNRLRSEDFKDWRSWSPIRGPSTIRLKENPSIGGGFGYCTVKISSEQYPANKTLLLLPGTNVFSVNLESSTDLSNWSTATNGAYTTPATMFFRIRNELIQ